MKKINVVVKQVAEQVLENAYCDVCGRQAESASSGPSIVEWDDKKETGCWKCNFNDSDWQETSKELVICPECFDTLYDFVKGGGVFQLPRKHLRVVK